MITLDWTLAASALIFLITLIGLNRLLFSPLFHILEERKAATTDVMDNAEEGQELYEAKVDEYEQRLKAERQAGYQRADELRNETLEQKQARVGEARSKAETLVDESRQKLESELEQARAKLNQEAEQIAADISEKVLSH